METKYTKEYIVERLDKILFLYVKYGDDFKFTSN